MSTSLMPLDPSMSPAQVTRLLPIRANLLPIEITSRRNARRMRTLMIAVVVLAVVGLGGWYADAIHARNLAQQDLDAVNKQIATAAKAKTSPELNDIVTMTNQNKQVSDQLKTLMATDLSWSALLDRLRATGAASHVTINRITATMADAKSAGSTTNSFPSTATASTVATLTIEGNGADQKTLAGFIDALGTTSGVANAYLTTATQAVSSGTSTAATTWNFTANADVTSDVECGRFTKACKTGSK